jgi:hypothetical protein
METFLTTDHLIYKISNSPLYAAVREEYLREIRQYVAEYQCLSNVPAHKNIKAKLFERVGDHLCRLSGSGQEIDLQVNQLQFDTGDFRLSA